MRAVKKLIFINHIQGHYVPTTDNSLYAYSHNIKCIVLYLFFYI